MVTRKTGMKNEAVYLIPKDVINLAANEACLRLQIVQQIKSMIIEYNFFMASMYFRHTVRRLACIIWSSLTGN